MGNLDSGYKAATRPDDILQASASGTVERWLVANTAFYL